MNIGLNKLASNGTFYNSNPVLAFNSSMQVMAPGQISRVDQVGNSVSSAFNSINMPVINRQGISLDARLPQEQRRVRQRKLAQPLDFLEKRRSLKESVEKMCFFRLVTYTVKLKNNRVYLTSSTCIYILLQKLSKFSKK